MRHVPLILLALVCAMFFTACDCPTPQSSASPAAYAACAPAPQTVQYVQVARPAPVQYVMVQQQPVQTVAVASAPCASGACAPAPQMVAAAPQVQYLAAAAPVGVEYKVGVPEVTRAGLAIPGNLVTCFGTFLRCGAEALFPTPTPSAKYVYAPPAPAYVQYAPAPAAAASGPCR